MSDSLFSGPFSGRIKEFVELKRACGYKFNTEAASLARFSKYAASAHPDETQLHRDLVVGWCTSSSWISLATKNARASCVRQFALYLCDQGENAYIIPKGSFPAPARYIPYIYTEDELAHFFAQTDKCVAVKGCPLRHLYMPLFFRLLYSCGLRSSEARLLAWDDVDLEEGILTIRNSKNDNSRLVPMNEQMTRRCSKYVAQAGRVLSDFGYFFPGTGYKPMTIGNVYHNFRRFLWNAGISHGGRGKGPRVHDFRHTYACHCLRKWVREGKDINVMLPVLKTYMGHQTYAETTYYLRMSAEVYPDLIIRLEGCYPELIPSLKGGCHESN